MNYKSGLIPVILGGDLNAYSVALSFKESLDVNSHVFTRYKCGATEGSRFITTHVSPDICDAKIALSELLSFKRDNSGSLLILIPSNDQYLEIMYEIEDKIADLYYYIIPRKEDYFKLTDKLFFYSVLDKFSIRHPKSYAVTKSNLEKIKDLNMEYPAVLKPTRSAEYNKIDFRKKKKVYFPTSHENATEIATEIYNAGYSGRLVLQEKISDKARLGVLTTLSGKDGRVIRASLGKAVLLERGDSSYGNYSAIITTPLDTVSLLIINMLNKLSSRGIANFDLMYLDGNAYCLELNARQGRSCDYLRGAGISLAEYFLENTVLFGNGESDFSFNEIFWHYPSLRTAMENLEDFSEYERILRLVKSGKSYTPFNNGFDGVKKRVYAIIHDLRQRESFRRQRKLKNDTL